MSKFTDEMHALVRQSILPAGYRKNAYGVTVTKEPITDKHVDRLSLQLAQLVLNREKKIYIAVNRIQDNLSSLIRTTERDLKAIPWYKVKTRKLLSRNIAEAKIMIATYSSTLSLIAQELDKKES